jgi:lipoprotein-anchoring transpeptidase ErfK/SrfK
MGSRLRARLALASPVFTLAALFSALAMLGCTRDSSSTTSRPVLPPPPVSTRPPELASAVLDASVAASDAGPAAYAGPWIESLVLQAPVMSEMEYPHEQRGDHEVRSAHIGTLRYGEKTPVIAGAHKKGNCQEGWYELVAGGFVCGKFATLDLDHPKLKQVTPPDMEGPLPYTYGINLVNGTPLYRQVPSHDERTKTEPWLFKAKKAKSDDDDPYAVVPASDAGVQFPTNIGEGAGDVKEKDWWEREAPDGGPPDVTLEDLEERDGPMKRRMVKGFYLSLDHQFPVNGTTWWKTVAGLVAPLERIIIAKPATEFHGVWLGKDSGTFATKNVVSRKIDKLPVAFVNWYFAKRYTLDASHKHATVTQGPVDRFDAVGLTGETARAEGYEYWETDEGYWIRAGTATRTEPGPPPRDIGEHEKWIDVNLKRQTLVAFEGTTPVFATMFSSGRNEHETPPGSFRIREKHITATMDGNADTATDGPYSIEDVPYIEYFSGGYALHGAFWHAEFGHIKSHGCVNLAPRDAKALFGWTDPQLPDGWHAVFATKENPGTRVIVHELAEGTCKGPKADPPQCPDGIR